MQKNGRDIFTVAKLKRLMATYQNKPWRVLNAFFLRPKIHPRINTNKKSLNIYIDYIPKINFTKIQGILLNGSKDIEGSTWLFEQKKFQSFEIKI